MMLINISLTFDAWNFIVQLLILCVSSPLCDCRVYRHQSDSKVLLFWARALQCGSDCAITDTEDIVVKRSLS